MASNPQQDRRDNTCHKRSGPHSNPGNRRGADNNKGADSREQVDAHKQTRAHQQGALRKEQNKGNRKNNHNIPKSELGSSTDLSNVSKRLECPICYEIFRTPIIMCKSGHSFCEECGLKLNPRLCPLCTAEITLSRNFAMESLLEELGVPCPNKIFGCTNRCTEAEVADHFNSCQFRQAFCPMSRFRNDTKCSWHGNQNKVHSHMKEAHSQNASLEFGRKITFENMSVSKADCDLQLMRFQGCLFLYHVKISPQYGLMTLAIQLMGSKEQASRWRYEMHLYDAQQPERKVMFSEPCTPDSVDPQILFLNGHCAAIPLKLVSTYIRDGKLTFKVYVNCENYHKEKQNIKPLMKFNSRTDLGKINKN